MHSREAKSECELHFRELGEHPSIQSTPEMMAEFYHIHRAEDCEVDEDGDMLLYQWGTYDWGAGRWFEINITRQFIPSDGAEDEILQLSLTLK